MPGLIRTARLLAVGRNFHPRAAKSIRRRFRSVTALFPGASRKLRNVKTSDSHTDGPQLFRIENPAPRKWTTSRAHFVVSGWAVDVQARTAVVVRIKVGKKTFYPYAKSRVDVQKQHPWAPTDCGFEQLVDLGLGPQRLTIEFKRPDGQWAVVRNSILLRLPAIFSRTTPSLSYSRWLTIQRCTEQLEKPEIMEHIDHMLARPVFSIIVDARHPQDVVATIASLRRQLYPDWRLCLLISPGDRGAYGDADIIVDRSLATVAGDYIVFAKSGDRLSDRALYEFASAINANPSLDMIYADEDTVASNGRHRDPFFKPDWSPDYLETFNYIGYPACFRTSLAKHCFGHGHYYDFVLRFTELSGNCLHLQKVLYHRAAPLASSAPDAAAARELNIVALEGRLARTGRSGRIVRQDHPWAHHEIELDLPGDVLVSIIIPTAAKIVQIGGETIDLVLNCVSRTRELSTYKNIEFVIVGNRDLPANTVAALERWDCRVVTYTEPVLNFPRKLNLGASMARGDMLILLNDDTEVIAPDWIERMLEHFQKPHVGVVGAKLLYSNGTIQHAGVGHNRGLPEHARRLFPRDDRGYFFSSCGVRNCSAVTGACMMTPKSVYARVGGYSSEFAMNLNDLDYCMKVRALGLYVVHAPRAELFHFESLSRAAADERSELHLYRQRWARDVAVDPFYNERCLSVMPPTFVPRINSRSF